LLRALVCLIGAGAVAACAQAETPFGDHFDNGGMSPGWKSRMPTRWVQDGWLHNRDTDGWPRDALAVVHDSDPDWTDYEVTLRIDPLDNPPWNQANLLLRTDNFLRSSGPHHGRAYQLEFYGPLGFDFHGIMLRRADLDINEEVFLAEIPIELPGGPFDARVKLEGPRIRTWLDGTLMFDVVDPEPLLFGGIGVHNLWESEARYDDIVVVPEPATLVLMLLALGLIHRR